MSVIVAVRVRPFNQREKSLNSKLCIEMRGKTTYLFDEFGNQRQYTFDHSFWSHDEYTIDEEGILCPKSDKYIDQRKMYNLLGQQVLQNCLDGYHCCLFAYGQTGSGKSYSMIGYGNNKGIVPMVSEEIFKKIDFDQHKNYEINVSMLEIYNEKVQDLLIPIDERPQSGLKIRESKTLGIYVQNLSKFPVNSYQQIERKMEEGNTNKTIASTQMNAQSSRAHTIIQIEIKIIEQVSGKNLTRYSILNLVDLAGSEKISKSGATGDRLKEGCSINTSLTVLGKVISLLADQSQGKNLQNVVPYRESSLTKILKNALGGNSKTLMICALSPSDNNYEETLSTLRYADRAKKIQCHAVINESETDKKIRLLQNENLALKQLIQEMKKGNQVEIERYTEYIDSDEQRLKLEEKINELQDTLLAHNKIIQEYEQSFEEKLLNKKQDIDDEKDFTVPHLFNINEDPILCRKIYHNLSQINQFYIGRSNGVPKPNIQLQGIGIKDNHAIIQRENQTFFIVPCQGASQNLYLNGKMIAQKEQLENYDRLMFGTSSLFIFVNPWNDKEPRNGMKIEEIDWEHCQMEINSNQTDFLKQLNDYKEKDEQLQSITEKCKNLQYTHNEEINKMKIEHENKIKKIEQEFSRLNISTQIDKQEMLKQEEQNFAEMMITLQEQFEQQFQKEEKEKKMYEKQVLFSYKEKDQKKLETKIAKIQPNIKEVNLISQEFKRKIIFTLQINYFYIDMENMHSYEEEKKKLRLKIEVDNRELGYKYYWNLPKFVNRYFMIKDMYNEYLNGKIPEPTQDQDPFWDPPEFKRFGESHMKLMNLVYLLDNKARLIFVDENAQQGNLEVELIPIKSDNSPYQEEDSIFEEFQDDPNYFIGKSIRFQMNIKQIKKNN